MVSVLIVEKAESSIENETSVAWQGKARGLRESRNLKYLLWRMRD